MSRVQVAETAVEPLLVDVGEEDGHLEPLREQQRELAGHQACTDHAHRGHRAGQRGVGRVDGPLGTALDEVERVEPGAQLVADEQLGADGVLGGEPVVGRAVAGLVHQVQRQRRRDRRPPGAGSDDLPAAGDALVPRRAVLDLGPVHEHDAADHVGRPAQGALQEVGRREDHVGDAEAVRLLCLEHAVLVERVLDDEGDGGVGAHQPRQQVGAAPDRGRAERALRQRDGRHARGHRAVRAVQRELEAAAERRAVEEREGRPRALTQPAEQRVAGLDALPGMGEVARPGQHREVGTGEEPERLAGDGDRVDVGACRPGRGPRRASVGRRARGCWAWCGPRRCPG